MLSCWAFAAMACSAPSAPASRAPGREPAAIAGPSPTPAPSAALGGLPKSVATSYAEPPALAIRVPDGFASAGIHVPRGQRQPLATQGRILAILPPAPSEPESGSWMTLELEAPSSPRLRLLLTPVGMALPFSEGDFVKADIDCRRGGWARICDGVLRSRDHKLLLAISGSGAALPLPDWVIQIGPLALSEARPKGPKSIRHTYGIVVRHARQVITVAPHEWQLLQANDGAWLVEGHAVRWEGARPLDAPDYLHYALVRAR
jgi:hypothetical protein